MYHTIHKLVSLKQFSLECFSSYSFEDINTSSIQTALELEKLSLCLLEVSGQLHAPAALPPGEEDAGTQQIGGWLGPRADLDEMEK
jgi:hypothetical protein